MHLVIFDLDGTLLNDASEISPFTKDTLGLMRDNNIAYSIATGRTMLSAKPIVQGYDFDLSHIYSNGVAVWNPQTELLTLDNILNDAHISTIIDVAKSQDITPFAHAIGSEHQPFVLHSETRHDIEDRLIEMYLSKSGARILPLNELSDTKKVTNISMIGAHQPINDIWEKMNKHDGLVAYSGPALEGDEFSWVDIHHRNASKGAAVNDLKAELGATNTLCFGDSFNDLSMLTIADESYAPDNAKDEIKQVVDRVIGHNDKDGIAHFLRERFSL